MSFSLLIALWVAVLLVNLFLFWSAILLKLEGCLPDIHTTFVPQEFILVCTL